MYTSEHPYIAIWITAHDTENYHLAIYKILLYKQLQLPNWVDVWSMQFKMFHCDYMGAQIYMQGLYGL